MSFLKHFVCGLLISLCFYSWGVFTAEGLPQFTDQTSSYESSDISKLKSINSGFQSPISGEIIITSPFGKREHPITGEYKMHHGVDIGADQGTPVSAVLSGKVVVAGWLSGYGNTVVIEHSDNFGTLYAHLSEILVTLKQDVSQGSLIGKVGATGSATAPHLHFELQRKTNGNWQAIDPASTIDDIKIAKVSPIPAQETLPDCSVALWGGCQNPFPPKVPTTPPVTIKPLCEVALFGECQP
jgi:murein DD-endopeptidase MepM/ murein hydrolase activator NlpD